MNLQLFEQLKTVPVGTRLRVGTEKQAYTVRARSDRYIVCNKPFNPRKTVLYFIIDLEKEIRGPENLVFPMGAETVAQCKQMILRLIGEETTCGFLQSEVSYRNCVKLDVMEILPPKAWDA